MRQVLLALFILIILSVGVVGYVESNNEPTKVIEDNDYSTRITS
ncbi:hypothetical protein [Lentibacillus sediminis]|nr:hypothetical protein [Lentibacillus sediminis]